MQLSHFQVPDEIISNMDMFFAQYICTEALNNARDDEEKEAIATKYEELENDPDTPFYLLEICRRILVEDKEEYGKAVSFISHLNKLIETKPSIIEKIRENSDYKTALTNCMMYLLPYAVKYFTDQVQGKEDFGSIACFDNLHESLRDLILITDPENIELINQFIDSLLNNADQLLYIIALKLSITFNIADQIKAKILEYVNFLLEQFPSSDINNQLIEIQYDILFTKMESKIKDFIIDGELNPELLKGSINAFFECIQTKLAEKQSPSQNEFKFIEKILHFLINLLRDLLPKSSEDESTNSEIISDFVNNFYIKFLTINSYTRFYFAGLISEFLLRSYKYFDLNLINENQQYFCNLIQSLCYINQIDEKMKGSDVNFFIDYYDINFNSLDFLSNRQNVAQFIYMLSRRIHNAGLIIILANYLNKLLARSFTENSIFIFTFLNKIVQSIKINNETLLNGLYILLNKFLKKGFDNFENIIKKDFFVFGFSSMINSSFYLVTKNSDKQENEFIKEFYNNWLIVLKNHVQEIPEDCSIDDGFYRLYFTFSCILCKKMIKNEMITAGVDELLSFFGPYSALCITNDAIELITIFSKEKQSQELFLQSFNEYITQCLEMVAESSKTIENEENDDENDQEHTLRFFNRNISKISNILRTVEISSFEEGQFELTEENKLYALAKVLIEQEDEQRNWVFMDESVEFFSALLSNAPNYKDWILFYLNTNDESERLGFVECIIPIIAAVSSCYLSIDQELVNVIINFLKTFIENLIEISGERKLAYTIDFLNVVSLIIRLFELQLLGNIQIDDDDFNLFSEFVFSTIPLEEDCITSTDYNRKAHKLGAYIFKMASFLIRPDQDEILQFFEVLVNKRKFVCDELRFFAIFLIDQLKNLKGIENDKLNELRRRCLENDLVVDSKYLDTYKDNLDNLNVSEIHPIFRFSSIDGFVFVSYDL